MKIIFELSLDINQLIILITIEYYFFAIAISFELVDISFVDELIPINDLAIFDGLIDLAFIPAGNILIAIIIHDSSSFRQPFYKLSFIGPADYLSLLIRRSLFLRFIDRLSFLVLFIFLFILFMIIFVVFIVFIVLLLIRWQF